ncbi:hypothetical protein FJZ36_14165 [Candidatus Poribacteria bacterium]|nr:hypothetical protein [Candidatus Poribacteria bacterium]
MRQPRRSILAFIALLSTACAAVASGQTPRATSARQLADALIADAHTDPALAPYPTFREHVVAILRRKSNEEQPLRVDPTIADLLGGNGAPAVQMRMQDVREFFAACARDELTILEALALVGRTVRRTGVLFYMDGRIVQRAVRDLDLSIGLAMPIDDLELFAYVPDARPDPNLQCRFVALYGRSYDHRFPKEVLDATLRIGVGRTISYRSPWRSGSPTTVSVVDGDVVYGSDGFGLASIHGVGGRSSGLLGLAQRVLFFLPDAIDSMVVQGDDLHVRAMVNTRVRRFRTSDIYAVHPNKTASRDRTR